MATLLIYDPQRKTIYECIGDIWDGCDKCYMPDTLNPVNETSMENLLEGTICKIERFKKLGYNVEVKWECEFKQELTMNAAMKSFVDNLRFDTLLEPRDAFFGGRTNAVCLYREVAEDEKIHYVDFYLSVSVDKQVWYISNFSP